MASLTGSYNLNAQSNQANQYIELDTYGCETLSFEPLEKEDCTNFQPLAESVNPVNCRVNEARNHTDKKDANVFLNKLELLGLGAIVTGISVPAGLLAGAVVGGVVSVLATPIIGIPVGTAAGIVTGGIVAAVSTPILINKAKKLLKKPQSDRLPNLLATEINHPQKRRELDKILLEEKTQGASNSNVAWSDVKTEFNNPERLQMIDDILDNYS